MFWTNQQNRPAEDEQQWPAETDNAPRRLIFNVTVSNEAASAEDCQVSQTEVLKLLAKQAQNQSHQHWEFVTEKVRAADFPARPHYFQPVIPRFFMAVTRSASFGPCLKCQIEAFDPAPVKKRSG